MYDTQDSATGAERHEGGRDRASRERSGEPAKPQEGTGRRKARPSAPSLDRPRQRIPALY
jgi:hypothetical protein